jgi:dienelactone hydrolase
MERFMSRIFFQLACLSTVMFCASANAAMHTQTIDYKIAGKKYQGFLAYDDAKVGKLPGVLLVHDWLGMGDQIKSRAKQVATLGYVAFAADIYDHNEAGKLAGAYMADRKLLRGRMTAALDVLKADAHVDPTHVAVAGYCFGGMGALELGRSGTNIAGIVTFHGLLGTPDPADAKQIKGRVLALQGSEDPICPKEQLAAFQEEMRAAKTVDWQLVTYGNTMHSFTVPTAHNPEAGMLYSPSADRRSWEAFKDFLAEVFAAD